MFGEELTQAQRMYATSNQVSPTLKTRLVRGRMPSERVIAHMRPRPSDLQAGVPIVMRPIFVVNVFHVHRQLLLPNILHDLLGNKNGAVAR